MAGFIRFVFAAAFVVFATTADAQVRREARVAASADRAAPIEFRARTNEARLAAARRAGGQRLMSGELGQTATLTVRYPIAHGRAYFQTLNTSNDMFETSSGAIHGFGDSRLFINLENLAQQRVMIDCTISLVGANAVDFYVGLSGPRLARVPPADGSVVFVTPPIDGSALVTLAPAHTGPVVYWTVTGCEVTPLLS